MGRRRRRLLSAVVNRAWDGVVRAGAIHSGDGPARRFAHFGEGASIVFPPAIHHGTDRIAIGAETLIGQHVTLSAGMPTLAPIGADPVLIIGSRCVVGRGSGIVAHDRVEVGDDVWTGHHVYITDQNHGYELVDQPIGTQMWANDPVRIGAESWLGHGAVVLPGTTLGRHVVVAAGSVVVGLTVPDRCVVAGTPARIVRRHLEGVGWVRTDPDGTPSERA